MLDARKPSFDEVRACPPLYPSSVQRTGQFEQHQDVAGLLFISGTAGHRRASAAMPSAAQERAAPAPSAAVHMAIFDATDPLVSLNGLHVDLDADRVTEGCLASFQRLV